MEREHNGTGTQWNGNTMEREHNGTGPQWNGNAAVFWATTPVRVLRREVDEGIGEGVVEFEAAALDAACSRGGGGGVPASGGVAHAGEAGG